MYVSRQTWYRPVSFRGSGRCIDTLTKKFNRLTDNDNNLLDSTRYFHKAAGINGVAQIVKDLGARADPRILAKAAAFYESSTVRRLGYLMERFDHDRHSKVLEPFANIAKSMKLLDPSIEPFSGELSSQGDKNSKWMILINEPVEIEY